MERRDLITYIGAAAFVILGVVVIRGSYNRTAGVAEPDVSTPELRPENVPHSATDETPVSEASDDVLQHTGDSRPFTQRISSSEPYLDFREEIAERFVPNGEEDFERYFGDSLNTVLDLPVAELLDRAPEEFWYDNPYADALQPYGFLGDYFESPDLSLLWSQPGVEELFHDYVLTYHRINYWCSFEDNMGPNEDTDHLLRSLRANKSQVAEWICEKDPNPDTLFLWRVSRLMND